MIREGLVLVQHRWRRAGWVYEFPGGAVDPGESPEDAAVRELEEETGLNGCQLLARVTAQNDVGGVIDFIVMSLTSSAEPRMTDDARRQTFYWLRPGDIPVETFPGADATFIHDHLPQFTACVEGQI
ncbi:NUDIX hydrolase [Pseudomonas putida]